MERVPKSGELYRHFKNRLYQVIAVAKHSETGEELVVYQALYGDFQVYARPLAQFMSEVDHGKYPYVKQRYRFECIERAGLQESVEEETQAEAAARRAQGTQAEAMVRRVQAAKRGKDAQAVNPKLMAFLDTDNLEERYNILVSMRDEVDDHMINSMAVVLDVVIPEGKLEERYDQLKSCIRMKQRYETMRLR